MHSPEIRNGYLLLDPTANPGPDLPLGPGVPQHLHGHSDMRGGGDPRALMLHLDTLVVARSGQQQARDELRGAGGVQGDRTAADPAAAADGERDGAPTLVMDHGAKLAKSGQQRSHRACGDAVVTAELHVTAR